MKKYLSQQFRQRDYDYTAEFEVRDQTAMILADPCYQDHHLELIQSASQTNKPVIEGSVGNYLRNMKPGRYRVEIRNISGYKHTASWTCKHVGTSTCAREIELDVPVDSGQVGLFFAHSAYQADKIPQDDIQAQAMELGWENQHPWYRYMCATSLNYHYVNAMGICTDSGWGDGCYQAFAYLNDQDEIVGVEVLFVEYCSNCGGEVGDCQCDDMCPDCGEHYEDCTCLEE